MATRAGSLVADLRLNSAAFIRDMAKAQAQTARSTNSMRRSMQQLERTANRVQRQFASLRTAAIGLAGALGVRQFGTYARRALDAADATAKVADSIGLTTTALQEWRVAAQLAGVDQAKFDSALQAFTKRMGELRAGTGALTTFLNKYDETLLQNLRNTQSAEEGLDIFLRTLAETSNELDRAALAGAAFGRGAGAQMVVLTRDGAEAMNAMRRSASELGLVLSQDLLRTAEQINDRMALLKEAFNVGFQRGVIVEMANAFQLTADNITAAREAGENFGTIVGTVVANVLSVVEKIGSLFKALSADIKVLQLEISLLAEAWTEFTQAGVQGTRDFLLTLGQINQEALKLRENLAMGDMAQQLGINAIIQDAEMPEKIANVTNSVNKNREAIGTWSAVVNEEAKDAARAFETNLNTAQGTLRGFSSAVAQENDALFRINQAFGIAEAIISTYQGAAAALKLGPIIGPPMAAAVIGLGAAYVAQIASAQPGGNSALSGSTGGSAQAAVTGASTAVQPQPGTSANITLVGDTFTQDQIRELFDQLNQGFRDGYRLNLVSSQ